MRDGRTMPCPGMAVADRRIDQQQATVGCAQRNGCLGEKLRVAAEYRRGQRTASAPCNRESIRFVAIGNDRRHRPEDFQFVDHLSVHAVVDLQERGRNKRSLGGVRIDRRERLRRIGNRRLSA